MSKNSLKKCSACGAEISKSAKVCPQCGQKNKEPTWMIILGVIVVIAIFASIGGGSESTTSTTNTESKTAEQQTIEYMPVTVATLIEELESNAMKAENTYNKKYVEITGKLNNIDSSGSYISLYPGRSDFELTGVQCYIKNQDQTNKVMEMNIGDTVTLRGKIKSVGEIFGYGLDIESIK